MDFLTLVGGVVVFGLLTLFVPRLSFIVALSVLLKINGVHIFSPDTTPGITGWDELATFLFPIAGIAGLLLDIFTVTVIAEHKG